MSQDNKRLEAELIRADGCPPGSGLPKHCKMTQSPFVFMRGTAGLFYADLARGRLRLPSALLETPLTLVMGDCHVSNFGFLTEEGSHGDRVVFAPNDFDDACVGHAGWDLARFGLSLMLCADHCQRLSAGELALPGKDVVGKAAVSPKGAQQALSAFLEAYVATCERGLGHSSHHEWALEDLDQHPLLAKRYRKALARAAGGDDFMSRSSLAKAVDLKTSPLKFRQRPERFRRLPKAEQARLEKVLAPYVDDAILDLVERQGAGTGSVNLNRYYLLVGPADPEVALSQPELCHIVEVKQQRQAAPLAHFPDLAPPNLLDPAHLTVVCQRRMQRDPDLVLDDLLWEERHWLVRSRHHARVGLDPEHLALGKKAVKKGGFSAYASSCGEALALAHARGDRRSTRFEAHLAKQVPGVAHELAEALESYVDQVVADWRRLCELETA